MIIVRWKKKSKSLSGSRIEQDVGTGNGRTTVIETQYSAARQAYMTNLVMRGRRTQRKLPKMALGHEAGNGRTTTRFAWTTIIVQLTLGVTIFVGRWLHVFAGEGKCISYCAMITHFKAQPLVRAFPIGILNDHLTRVLSMLRQHPVSWSYRTSCSQCVKSKQHSDTYVQNMTDSMNC